MVVLNPKFVTLQLLMVLLTTATTSTTTAISIHNNNNTDITPPIIITTTSTATTTINNNNNNSNDHHNFTKRQPQQQQSSSSSSSSSSLSQQQQHQQLLDFLQTIHYIRQDIFTYYIEPLVVTLFGPVVEEDDMEGRGRNDYNNNNKAKYDDHPPPQSSSTILPPTTKRIITNSSSSTHQHSSFVSSSSSSNNDKQSNPATRIVYFPPLEEDDSDDSIQQIRQQQQHRRLGFLPPYVSNVNAFKETTMSFASLIMLFITMFTIFLIFLSCFYHNQKTCPLFMSPRKHRLPLLVPPLLPVDGYVSWIKICFLISDEEIINRIGYDSLIFLRFHRLALRCIVKMSVFSFIVLLPLNYTGGGHNASSTSSQQDLKEYVGSIFFTDFLRFSMANVQPGSSRLWVHCFAAYLLTAIVIRELLREYATFHNIRHRYLLSREPHLRTVLVTNIPRHLRSATKIENYFKNVYPHAVKNVIICQNLIHLERLVSSRHAILSTIEQELLIIYRSEKKKLYEQTLCQKIMSWLRCTGTTIGSTSSSNGNTQYYNDHQERLAILYAQLEELNTAIEREQRRRKRVMKMLDRMAAGEGAHDIDYVLASPFVSTADDPTQRRILGLQPLQPSHQSQSQQAQPMTATNDTPTTAAEVVVEAQEKNRLRSRSPPTTATTIMATGGGQAVAGENDDDDKKKDLQLATTTTKTKTPFWKARKAITQYGKFHPETSLLGKPIHSSSGQQQHGNNNNNGVGDNNNNNNETIEDHINEVTDKAFVVMRTFTAATIAIQSMHSSKPGSMQVSTAPEPRDILWNNIYMSKGAHRTRSYLGEFLVLLLITFYVVPMAMVSLLVSESALISSSPRLAQLSRASAFFAALIGLVQPLFIVGLQQLLPPLFIAIGRAEGITAFSEVQMRAFSRYFLFQVINVFLVTTIAGSIFDTVAIIIENPESAFEMLGNSLPRLSSFFITFITIKTFLGLGFELVRVMALLQATARFILFPNATLRMKRVPIGAMRAIDDPGWFPFHKILAQDMLVVVISVVFAVVAPLVTLPCALFCLCSRIVWTHHHLYVYESVFESGGQFWPKIFRRFVFGLIIAQMTIAGQFIVKEARHEAYATIALMFLTYVFLRSTRARYDPTSSALPLEVATVMDISLRQDEAVEMAEDEWRRQQQQPQDPQDGGAAYNNNNNNIMSPRAHDGETGALIGRYDPFQKAYVQPALRANPRARPEQPFPAAQLGPEDQFLMMRTGGGGGGSSSESTSSTTEYDHRATVRLKSMNQQDRRMINRWWNDQLQRAGDQNILAILIGEECGTLTISGPGSCHPSDYDLSEPPPSFSESHVVV